MSLDTLDSFIPTDVNFNPDSVSLPDGGVTNTTQPYTNAPPDASGGSGSFLNALLPTLSNGLNAGLNAGIVGALGGGTNLYTVDAYGNLVPKAAASANNSRYAATVAPLGTQANPLTSALQANGGPLLLIGGLALLALLVFKR